MPSRKRGSDNSTRSSRPSSSKSTKVEEPSEENSRDTIYGIGTSDNPPSEYAVNTRILCQHTDSFYYDAKIIQAKHEDDTITYTIHYNGWNSRYDEELSHTEAVQKFLPYTAENVAMAKGEIANARKRKRTRAPNRKRDSTIPSKKHRSTTPKTDSSARNTPIDFGDIKPTPTKHEIAAATAALNETPIPKRVHPSKIEIKFPPPLLEVLIKDNEIMQEKSKLVKLPADITVAKIKKDYEESDRISNLSNGGADLYGEFFDAFIKTFCQTLSTKLIIKFEINQFLEILNKKRNDFGYADITFAQYQSALSGNEKMEEAPPEKDEPMPMRETRSKRHSKAAESEKKETSKKVLQQGFLKDDSIPFHTVYGFIHFVRFLYQFANNYMKTSISMYNFYAPIVNDLLDFLVSKKDDYYNQEKDYETPLKTYKPKP